MPTTISRHMAVSGMIQRQNKRAATNCAAWRSMVSMDNGGVMAASHSTQIIARACYLLALTLALIAHCTLLRAAKGGWAA